MNKVVIDANIIINVWRLETNPATGLRLYEASSELLESVLDERITGILLTTTAMEILHRIRVSAETTGKSPDSVMRAAEKDISRLGLQMTIPDAGVMGMAYDVFRALHIDPYDAVMIAAAVSEKAGAVISRDRKLKRKASRLISVLSPEEFLGR